MSNFAMIVIPTYNERNNIEPLLKRIRAVLPDEQVLFVDDSSPDGTAVEIRRLAVFDKGIILKVRPSKMGLASAYLEVFKSVVSGGLQKYVITMDGDQSHQPETLPVFMEKLRSFDVVIGSRYVHGGQVENWSTARRILSRAANLYSRCLTGLPVKDTTSGYMGIRTEVLAKADLTKVRSLGFAYLMEFKKALFEVTDKVVEVPIDFVERRQGSSKFGWKIFMEGLVYPWKVFMTRILRTLDF